LLLWLGLTEGLLTGCDKRLLSTPAITSTASRQKIASNIIRLANGIWPPYNSPDLPYNGCDSRVITEAFALEGIQVEYGFFPWARSYSLSATGEWDGTLAWDDTPEHRAQHLISAEPTTIQEWVFFFRRDHPFTWKTLDDLAGKIVGVTTGYVYSDAFKHIKSQGKVTFLESSSDEINFKMLLAGRIDVFPMERRVGHYIMGSIFNSGDQSQIDESAQPITAFRTFLLLSKAVAENGERMNRFNQGFSRLRESGRYDEIIRNCSPNQ